MLLFLLIQKEFHYLRVNIQIRVAYCLFIGFSSLLFHPALFFCQFRVETIQEILISLQTLQSFHLGSVLASQISLDLEPLLNDGHLLILIPGLLLCLLNLLPGIPLILIQMFIECLHVLLQHMFSPLQALPMEPGQLLKLINLLSFVIDQHLEQQHLSFLFYELVHGFGRFHAILNGALRGFD